MRSRFDMFVASLLTAVLSVGLYVIAVGTPVQAAYVPVPSGTIAFFDRTTATGCPSGWTEFTNARGAYIVGLTNGGTKTTLVGTALTDQENRAVGQHTHTLTVTLNDPGHIHNGRTSASPVAGYSRPSGGFASADSTNGSGGDNFTTSNTTGITVSTATAANAGSVAGTNAPYIQLLACSKT